MSDIVERLRIGGLRNELEAADEIERLRKALREIVDCKTFTDRQYMIDIARAALGEKA